jgi:hypothetical protein
VGGGCRVADIGPHYKYPTDNYVYGHWRRYARSTGPTRGGRPVTGAGDRRRTRENGLASFGVAIPTHQGSTRLARSMLSLAGQQFDGDLHVVVAVNDDRTDSFGIAQRLAPLVRRAGASCTVIRTATGRSAALRAADRHLPRAPRLYLDQDALLSRDTVARLAATLGPSTGVHFAVPRLRLARCRSAVSRAYYRAWRELPYVRHSPVTCGAYAVSAEGRERWHELPTMHSDDKWVRWHFAPHERAVVRTTSYEVMPPDGVRDLLRARRRYHRGNRELAALAGDLCHADDSARYRGALRSLLERPDRWPGAAILVAVHAAVAVLVATPPRR